VELFPERDVSAMSAADALWHHHMTIPYYKEENGILERSKKVVDRHIRNIMIDKDIIKKWYEMLCVTEKLLNSTVKQPLGVVTLLFVNACRDTPLLRLTAIFLTLLHNLFEIVCRYVSPTTIQTHRSSDGLATLHQRG